jgi:putative ABC transport system permease protein
MRLRSRLHLPLRRKREPTWRSVVRPADLLGVGLYGLRGRTGRSILTAVGISIGIASIVAVFGISASSKADLLAQIDDLGTDLLVVQAGNTMFGDSAQLPVDSTAMVRRITPVRTASAISALNTEVQRHQYVDDNNGIDVLATEPELFDTIEGTSAHGRLLDAGTSTLPTVVLGSVAAERLGIADLTGSPTVEIGGRPFAVVGILDSLPLHPDLDRSVFVGNEAATTYLGVDLYPTRIYLRTDPRYLDDVRSVLGRTVNPTAPNEVDVSRPSDVLEARARVDEGLQRLLIGLGLVALGVGGVGVANVMVISVLERRTEIGLRRALGATRHHIGLQFLVESATLTTIGGIAGASLGAGVTYLYARQQHWTVAVPTGVLAAAVGAALALGALAGLYPAARAATMHPADAVRPTG